MALAGIGAAAASRRQFLALARLQARFLDRVRGIATIVLYGQADAEARSLAAAADELRVRTMRVLRVAFLSSAALDLAAALALVVLALRYGMALLAGHLAQPAAALFVLLLVPEFFAPLRGFAAAYQDRLHATGAAEALVELPPLPEPQPPHARSAPWRHAASPWRSRMSGSPGTRRAGRRWTGCRFRVPAGETLVLAGPSGAGKSTVIEILLGFVRPDSGRVTINGADITDLVPQALSRLTAWIGQRPVLFAGTIRDNIRFARPEATDAEVEDAARSARVSEFAAALPDGLDTHGGRGRLWPVRRPGAARGDRPRVPEERAAAAARRTDRASRSGHRGRGAGQPAPPGLGPHGDPGQPLLGGARLCRAAARHPRRPRGAGARCGMTGIGDLLRILALWRGRAWPGWRAGVVVSLAALAAGVGHDGDRRRMVGCAITAGVLAAPVALRGLGTARVVLRYGERLVTHAATFRALADLRVWFFRNLARTAAGGLGFRQAGDVLARLVGDVEALDGLYLRILVPLAGAVLLLPVLVVLIGVQHRRAGVGDRHAVRDRRLRAAVDRRAHGAPRRHERWPTPPARCASPRSMR